jgi:CubicO group peptidase (beta-lactamase class C family)
VAICARIRRTDGHTRPDHPQCQQFRPRTPHPPRAGSAWASRSCAIRGRPNGWGGIYGTTFFVDPRGERTVVLVTNTALDGMYGQFTLDVEDAVYA